MQIWKIPSFLPFFFNPSLRKRKDITKSYQGGGGQGQLDDRGVGVEGNHQNDYDSNLLEKDHL